MDKQDNQEWVPNKGQEKVINYGEGSLLVEAGPGSGKTTVIVERIVHLINEGVDPESFLVITFTNKAADNLKNKLREKLPSDVVLKMQISTIHSFCLEYLKSKNQSLTLIDDDTSEKKMLFIKKFREELGFINEATVFDYHIPAILKKFGEYTCFNVDSESLIRKIDCSREITNDYINFVNSMEYFSKKCIDDHDKPFIKLRHKKSEEYNPRDEYGKSWYNARYLQIAKAYPKYLELLDKYDYVDYDTLQLKTLKELEKDSETRFKTIFVDEFQDTDPLQYRIFEILRAECNYFTAVGDVDQHIYAFRSSFNDFFDESIRLNHIDSLSLDVNYRSTENIVKLTEGFIQCRRKDTSQKHMVNDKRKNYNNPNFLIENRNSDDEANLIYEIVKELKDKKSIKDSDIAILYRKHSDNTIGNLIELFDADDDINYSIRGQSNLAKQGEVKSLITMLWYVSRKTNYGYVPSSDELDESTDVTLKAFCGDYFKPSIDESTQKYLCCLQQSFYDEVMEIQKNIPKKEGDGSPRYIHTLKKNKTQDTLFEIFEKVQMPVIDIDKIESEKDRKFFEYLDNIRAKIVSEKPPTVLDVFYDLLSLTDYFDDVETNHEERANLALLTQTISNYESFISETNVKEALFFLRNSINNYDSYLEDDEGIQLMTIHAAKGLEFPVTIITSLEKDNFPMINKDPNREKDNIFPNDTYYTPNECLKYKTVLKENVNGKLVPKTISIEEENQLNDEEEDRILYVAMTRAADLLILSTIGEVPEQIERIREFTTPFNFDDLLDVTICGKNDAPGEAPVLNYSKYTQYDSCQFKYYLSYELGFARPGGKAANRGTVFHNIMEKANQKLMVGEVLTDDKLIELTYDKYKSMFNIDENQKDYEKFKKNVMDYYRNYSQNLEVLDAELDFEFDRGDYIFNGAIDLIYKSGENEIIILDYKYACSGEDKLDAYTKQLHLYAAALKELPEYKDYKIKKAITHFVRNDNPHEVVITDEKINNELKCLDKVAREIGNPEHIYVKDADDCGKCPYSVFCKKE